MARTKSKNKPAEKLAKDHPEGRHPLAKPYRVMCGKHHEPSFAVGSAKPKYTTYTTGDVVWSPRPLDKVFSNRFLALTEKQAEAEEGDKGYDVDPDAKAKLTIVPRGNDRFDVMDNKTGATLNEEYLTFEDAKKWEETGIDPTKVHVEASAKA